jgi:hypothetical protein
MTKGQRAMIAAKVRLLNRQSTRAVAGSTSVSSQYVGFASIVLQYAPDLVGTSPLSRRRAVIDSSLLWFPYVRLENYSPRP